MKNKGCALILFIFIFSNVFAQSSKYSRVNPAPAEKKIIWKKFISENILDVGKRSLLTFDGASYDLKSHFAPIYSQKISLPLNTTAVEVKIENAVYQVLSDSEKIALNNCGPETKKVITNEIAPSTSISVFRKKPYAFVQFIPIRKNNLTGNYEKLISFSLQISPIQFNNRRNSLQSKRSYALNSVLANGKWYKISVTSDGIYKMDYSFLKRLGMRMDSLKTQNIRIYGNGGGQLPFANAGFRYDDLQENAIEVVDQNNNGNFDSTDYVLFYGQAQHRWQYDRIGKQFHHNLNIYSDTTYYFVTKDLGTGKRIVQQNSSSTSPTNIVSSFDDYQFHELEEINLLKSGRVWHGETFDIVNAYNFTFSFPDINTSSAVYAKVVCSARRDPPGTDFSWNLGNQSSSFNVAGVATTSLYGTYYTTNFDTIRWLPTSSSIPLNISKTTPSPAIGWLDYVEINARRNLNMNGSQIIFRDAVSADTGKVSQFIISNVTPSVQVWEVTDRINVKSQQVNNSGNTLDFTLPTDSIREFIAFNGQSFLFPKAEGQVPNQNLHAMTQSDLIIVTNPLFLQQANKLANYHSSHDNLTFSVATTQEIFNEYSSGSQDVSAIRDFVKMFYDRAADSTQLPKYLLLFGRGSYDLKSTINNTNYIPAYESYVSDSPTASYPSDDFYGMLDNNEGNWDVTPDVLDIGIGRLPVKSPSEAEYVVNKIMKYTSVPGTIETGNSCTSDVCYGLGDWINVVTFCADDEDNDSHIQYADMLAAKVNSLYKNYNIDKIYLDAYQQVSTPGGDRYPDANAALNHRVEKGCLIMNWTGHGGALGWAHERFLEIHDINSWNNQCKLPFFFTATCDFSVWDNPAFTSAGELTLLNPTGGSIGLLSTTRVVYGGPNFDLNNHFYDYVFAPLPNGNMPRIGDIYLSTKTSMPPSQTNHRNFSLLGDPALSLNYPKYSVTTTKINGTAVNSANPDTIRALSKVTVNGEVHDMSGNLLTNFNGIIYPTVFDKASKITTLSNDGAASPAFTFFLQKNGLFKGKSIVTGGKFSFSFIVPKDIAYNFDKGKISYYSHNGYLDASGYFDSFIIGGTDSTAAKDTQGPGIKLYMNDDKFVYGGVTNANPKIFAIVSDSSGINTAGASIGHDITGILDANTAQPIVLNDYYESDLNNYKKGTILYPLSSLADGTHNLNLRVWDVYNNSSSSYTEFVVASSAALALKHVLNYPNPFTTKTSFYFEHNKCCTNMDVSIQIFTVSGKLIKSIYRFVNMEGYRSDPIDWDGTDDYGDKIARGVYIYRIRVKVANETAEQFEKLVILK